MKSVIVRLFVPAEGSSAVPVLHGLVEQAGAEPRVFRSGPELLGLLDETRFHQPADDPST